MVTLILFGQKIILNAALPIEVSNGIKFTDGSTITSAIPSGYTGSRGAQGAQGPQGPTGSAGLNGAAGFVGSRGPTGFTGSQGIQGLPGDVGNLGYTGSRGTNGDIGFTGSSGYTGSAGFTGSRGEIGYTGSGAGIATTSTLGSIIVGDGLQVNVNGKVDVVGGSITAGKISLTQDMDTNGYKIKDGTAFLTIDSTVPSNDIITLQNGTFGSTRTPPIVPQAKWQNYFDIVATSATISTSYWNTVQDLRYAKLNLVSVEDTSNYSDTSYSIIEVYNDFGNAVYPNTVKLNLTSGRLFCFKRGSLLLIFTTLVSSIISLSCSFDSLSISILLLVSCLLISL
jgi:hypothetical protein